MFEISKGIINKAQKVVIYGPEGIGKSTFASKFPNPFFIDTEGSTSNLDVKRLPRPTSYQMLIQEVDYVLANLNLCDTLVIDTVDWAEQLIVDNILSVHQKKGIEDFGYGNGYVYVKEEFGRFLNKLSTLVDRGVNVVLTAHAQIRKFEQPDELGAYDRYELKLGHKTRSQTSPLVKEWCDMLLFANYKTLSVATDKDGKKHKAQGGTRVMYTSHHPCWDAKNRFGLPDEVPFDYSYIAPIIISSSTGGAKVTVIEENEHLIPEVNRQESQTRPQKEKQLNLKQADEAYGSDDLTGLPQALQDLMHQNKVTKLEIQNVVYARGYYPLDMPLEKYPKDFIDGVLIGAWPQLYKAIIDERKKDLPFY